MTKHVIESENVSMLLYVFSRDTPRQIRRKKNLGFSHFRNYENAKMGITSTDLSLSYLKKPFVFLQITTSISITGTSIKTPTTVASAAPE